MIFIIESFRTIVFIFIVISTTFKPMCPLAIFRCLLSKFLKRSLMIFIIDFRTVFIFIVISTTFKPMCPLAIFRCLLSKFLRRSLMIFIIRSFQTIVFIFIVIFKTFRPICLPDFFWCLSNSGTFTELRTTSFIESTRLTCSDSINHKRVQVVSIPILLLACSQDWTCNLQMPITSNAYNRYVCVLLDTERNDYRRWFSKLLRRQS